MNSFFIKDKEISPPLVLAPMAGLSEKKLRRTLFSMKSVGFAVTDLVPAEGCLRKTIKMENYLGKEDFDFTALQLCGGDSERIFEAAQMAVEYGAKFIDINMGCPVNKIVKGGGGSALLKDPEKAGKIVEKISKNLNVVVTAKIRSGYDEKNINFVETGKALEEGGASAVAIHPRTRAQMYHGRANWDHIKELKENLKIPVVGNGDILTAEDAKKMFEKTGCDGVMIGRGAVKNPFIFRQIIFLFSEGRYEEASGAERLNFLIIHFKNLIEELPEQSALHFMKVFVGKYTKGMAESAKLRQNLSVVKSPKELLIKIEEFKEDYQKKVYKEDILYEQKKE
ncbi:MAG: tRNA dihydrouridine synthase DusB [Acidobacteria bacterium]|nr:tRNA dihydrouridine synthase DusB [Acidobacteriota bacterium]